MSLHSLLARRAQEAGPIRVGVIGAGKFGTMFLTQALHSDGLHVVAVADLDTGRARSALDRAGWPGERYAAASYAEALRTGGTYVTDSADGLLGVPGLEVVCEMTGDPVAGAYHAERASDAGLHVVMVNVEATFEARTGYARRCFGEYGVPTDPTGRYAALYRPCHLIGLEVGVSIASAVLRAEPTGTACGFHGDAVAVAKRDLEAGEVLDGEGGYMVYGKLAPAAASMRRRALPIGLARGVELCRDVPAGGLLSSADVRLDESLPAVRLRRELEASWLAAAGT